MDTKVLVIGGGIIGLVVLVIMWQARKDAIAVGGAVVSGAKAVGNAVNPLNPDNVAAGTVNNIGSVLAGDNNFSLGAWLYNETHPTLSP
jgi:hypothetical protein